MKNCKDFKYLIIFSEYDEISVQGKVENEYREP